MALKWLPNGDPDYDAPLDPKPAGRTIEQCKRELRSLDAKSPMGIFLRQRIAFLQGEEYPCE